MKKSGPGSERPTTLIEDFQMSVKKYGDLPALSKKVNDQWVLQQSCRKLLLIGSILKNV
jgi:hypothetical protein